MTKQDRDFIAPLMAQNTTESWAEAICIAIAQLKDKDGKALQVFLSDDYAEHIRLCGQIAKSLRGEPNPAFKNYMGDNWAGIV